MGPLDYTSYNDNVQNPIDAGMQGIDYAHKIRDDAQQQDAQKVALERQSQFNQHLLQVANDPTPNAISKLSIAYPEYADKLKAPYEQLNEQDRQTKINAILPVAAAIHSGNNDIAISHLEQIATANENSGDTQAAGQTRAIINSLRDHPEGAKFTLNSAIAGLMGPDKYAQTMSELNKTDIEQAKAPVEIAKTKAETDIKQQEAANLPEEQSLKNDKLANEAETLKLERKMKVIDAQLNSDKFGLDKEKLQVEKDKINAEIQAKQQAAGGTQQEKAQTAMDGSVLALDFLNKAISHPGLEKATGFGGSVFRFFSGSQAANFESLIQTVESDQFKENIHFMVGMGALSDAEGKRITNMGGSLAMQQDPETFRGNLKYMKKTIEKAQANLISQGKLPDQGGGFVMEHPKLGKITEGTINKILMQRPGLTREALMNELESKGGADSGY